VGELAQEKKVRWKGKSVEARKKGGDTDDLEA